jgi:hypothetical protein
MQLKIKNTYFDISYHKNRKGQLALFDNGGRVKGECLDMTLWIWKISMGLTIFDMKYFTNITRWLPKESIEFLLIGTLGVLDE